MADPCNQPLKPNPFLTARDPATGRWVVVHNMTAMQSEDTSRNASKS